MPYIPLAERQKYKEAIEELASLVPQDPMLRPGHMNYIVSLMIEKIYGAKKRYSDHNEIIGVLHCIALEFYRRKTAPYEDGKIVSEGDLED